MRLTRNTTTDANPDLRGRKHYFTIENAPAIVLEAMDEMLVKAGWENDGCPCYDDGFGCGWWIDLSEIADFKAAYKEAKAGVRGYMARRSIKAHFGARVTDIEAAHAEALAINAECDRRRALSAERTRRDCFHELTEEQQERYYAQDYDEAYAYDRIRNQAIRDEEVQLTTQIEFNKRQYIWEEVYSEEYKAIRLEVAHGIALAMDANYASADQMAHEFLTEQAHAEALPMTATEAIRHMANTLTRHMEQSELPGFDADAAYGDIKANFDEVAARCNDRAITVWLRNHLCFGYMGDTYTFTDVNKPYRDQFTHILNTSWRPEESATLTLTTIFEMDWWGAAEITVTKRDGDKVYGTASVTDTEGLYQIAFEWLMDMGEEADRVGLPAVVSITGGKFILPNEVFLQRDNGTPLDVVEAIQEMDCVLGLSADIINEVYAEEAQGK